TNALWSGVSCTSICRSVGAGSARVKSDRKCRKAAESLIFHHKHAVRTITDFPPHVGDNGDRPVGGRSVPVSRDGPRSSLSPTRQHSLTTRRVNQRSQSAAEIPSPT